MSRGCRPLSSKAEERVLLNSIEGTYALRNRALAITGLKTSLRVSELLALKVEDVFDPTTGRFKSRIYLVRQTLKGRKSGRSIPLNKTAAFALGRWFVALRKNGVPLRPELPVFVSRQGGKSRAIDRSVAFRVMRAAARKGGLEDGIGTHSWRKTAARRAYEASGHDLLAVSRILGHTSVLTTVAYLSWDLDTKADGILRSL
jgi:integrase